MKKRTRMRVTLLALFILIAIPTLMTGLVYWGQVMRSGGGSAAGSWLVAGPFHGNGDNGLFKDYLSGVKEALSQARDGDLAAWGLAGIKRWQAAELSDEGVLDFKKLWDANFESVAYAYTEIESDADRYVSATVGSGTSVQIRVNGDVVYESRVFRRVETDKDTVVFPLRKGINPVLVKAQKGLSWSFQWKVNFTPGKLFANETATIIPDFHVTEQVGAWGQVEVANVSGSPLQDVRAEVMEDDLLSPSQSEQIALGPQEVQRIPIWIASKKVIQDGATPRVHLRVTAGSNEYSFDAAPRVRNAKTSFVTTYRSTVDGSVQPYSVLLPPSFNKKATYPLIILLHGSHVTTWGINISSYTPKEWAIQVAVHDRGNNNYRGIGEVDINEVLSAVTKRYIIDPDSLFLSGHSMGGYGAWFLAVRYPDRWAAISPQTAHTELSLSDTTMRESENVKQQRFQNRLLQSWSPITFAENLLYVPAYMMHGAKDASLPVSHSRIMCARLDALGYEHTYDENPEGGHWWGTRGEHEGTLCVDNPEISEFFLKHRRRVRDPRLVIYKTDSLRYRQAYWVTINELDAENSIASIRAEIVAPNSIAVQLDNITEFTLRLNEQMVARGQPVTVSVNGNTAFSGLLPALLRLTIRRDAGGDYAQVVDAGEGNVAGYESPASSIQLKAGAGREESQTWAYGNGRAMMKSEQLYGPILDAFNKPFLVVVGTGGAGEEANRMNQASRRAAQAVVRDWMTRVNGIAKIKADNEVTTEEIASYNLILFGNAATNSLISRINEALPIRFTEEGITVGERVITASDAGMLVVRPNPLNQGKYIVVFGGRTPRSMELAARLRLTDLPDYVVFDAHTLSGKRVEFVDGGFFDERWQIPNKAVSN